MEMGGMERGASKVIFGKSKKLGSVVQALLQIVLFCLLLVSGTVPLAAKPPRQTEVIIIGAGLSGLAAAYELKKAHVPYHILELTPRVGGRVRTVRYHRPGEPEIYADSGMEEYWQS